MHRHAEIGRAAWRKPEGAHLLLLSVDDVVQLQLQNVAPVLGAQRSGEQPDQAQIVPGAVIDRTAGEPPRHVRHLVAVAVVEIGAENAGHHLRDAARAAVGRHRTYSQTVTCGGLVDQAESHTCRHPILVAGVLPGSGSRCTEECDQQEDQVMPGRLGVETEVHALQRGSKSKETGSRSPWKSSGSGPRAPLRAACSIALMAA